MEQSARMMDDANRILKNARDRLREGKYAGIPTDCDRAIVIYSDAGFPTAAPAQELLAECYIAQKGYMAAAKEAFQVKDCSVGSRLYYTRAIILVRIGRPAEAKAMIDAAVGTPEKPIDRKGMGLWELPSDRGVSDDELLSSAYCLRSIRSMTSADTDARDDLETGLKLEPNNPAGELLLASYYYEHQNYQDAIVHIERAKKLGNAQSVAFADGFLELARRARDQAAARKKSG